MTDRFFRWVAVALAIFLAAVVYDIKFAHAKSAAINHGLGGQMLANLGPFAVAARAKGYTTEIDGNPNGKTLVVAHSISCLGAVASNAKKIVLVSCPFWFVGRTSHAGSCVHYRNPGAPFIGNCRNISISSSHIGAPSAAKRAIIAQMR